MEMISKGQIADRTRFNFENNNFGGIVEYYNGALDWIIFDKKWNEKGKKNLFEMFNIQSTMVADFELIEDNNIEGIENEVMRDDWRYYVPLFFNKINELVRKYNELDKEIKELKK